MPVDRTEAVTYLKEVLTLCHDMSPDSLSFEKPHDSNSVGYRVHIKGTIREADRQVVRDIAKKYNLSVKEDSDGIVIFRPR